MTREDLYRYLLASIEGEDPSREGLLDTPSRVAKALDEKTSGYLQDPAAILKCFEDGHQGYDELVCQTNIPVYSLCEHHMEAIIGVAHVGYFPNGRVVGLSKLNRLVDCFARRLQVQERMTVQIAHALRDHLEPRGVGVMLQCRHLCMEARGVRARGTVTTTSCLLGELRDDAAARSEFLRIVSIAQCHEPI